MRQAALAALVFLAGCVGGPVRPAKSTAVESLRFGVIEEPAPDDGIYLILRKTLGGTLFRIKAASDCPTCDVILRARQGGVTVFATDTLELSSPKSGEVWSTIRENGRPRHRGLEYAAARAYESLRPDGPLYAKVKANP